ncbi:MAG: hypothetical protein WDW38_010479 [Sanguina aurantia]
MHVSHTDVRDLQVSALLEAGLQMEQRGELQQASRLCSRALCSEPSNLELRQHVSRIVLHINEQQAGRKAEIRKREMRLRCGLKGDQQSLHLTEAEDREVGKGFMKKPVGPLPIESPAQFRADLMAQAADAKMRRQAAFAEEDRLERRQLKAVREQYEAAKYQQRVVGGNAKLQYHNDLVQQREENAAERKRLYAEGQEPQWQQQEQRISPGHKQQPQQQDHRQQPQQQQPPPQQQRQERQPQFGSHEQRALQSPMRSAVPERPAPRFTPIMAPFAMPGFARPATSPFAYGTPYADMERQRLARVADMGYASQQRPHQQAGNWYSPRPDRGAHPPNYLGKYEEAPATQQDKQCMVQAGGEVRQSQPQTAGIGPGEDVGGVAAGMRGWVGNEVVAREADDNNDEVNGLDELEPVPEDQREDRDDNDDEGLGAPEEDEGEDLMDNMNQDYRAMPHLDAYDRDGIDDEPEEGDADEEYAARVRAEAELDERDAGGGGRKKRMPDAFAGDDMDEVFDPASRRRRQSQGMGAEEPEPHSAPRCGCESCVGGLSGCVTQEAQQRGGLGTHHQSLTPTLTCPPHPAPPRTTTRASSTTRRSAPVRLGDALCCAPCPRSVTPHSLLMPGTRFARTERPREAGRCPVLRSVPPFCDPPVAAHARHPVCAPAHAQSVPVKLDEVRGRLSEWVTQEAVADEVKRLFRRMLKTLKVDSSDTIFYRERLIAMQSTNSRNLEVQYTHIASYSSLFAMWMADCPRHMLEYFNEAAKEVALELFSDDLRGVSDVGGSSFEVFVRITGIPILENLRDLRNYHLNCLVKLRLVKYDCVKCGYTMGPFATNTETEVKPNACPSCQSKGPFSVNSTETVYRDYQKLTLQESPGKVPAGRLPRHKEVILTHDLIDCARPGEEIEVTAVYVYSYDMGLNIKNSFPVFSTHLEANYISKREDLYSIYALTDEDRQDILTLSKDPRIGQRIMKSIAPSIYGHEFIKTGLALALFGGQEKNPSPAHRLRGDINMLLLGDPGVAKSQFLKYVEKTATRAVYTTGADLKGALGLLKEGKVDEFDKMVANFQATSMSINVGLAIPFDILCVVRDIVDPVNDQKLAEFVVGNHSRSHPDNVDAVDELGPTHDPDILPQALLRKYITYSKQNCKPMLQTADYDRITEVYARLRQEASRTHGMPVAVRHLESVVRMSEAHARMHLRDYVSDDDISVAIKMMVGSFIQTQKYSVHKTLQAKFKRYLTLPSDFHALLLSLLRGLLRDEQRNARLGGLAPTGNVIKIQLRNLEEKAREHEIFDLKDFIESDMLTSSGFTLQSGGTVVCYTEC